jgi:hypothetical protein
LVPKKLKVKPSGAGKKPSSKYTLFLAIKTAFSLAFYLKI